MDLNNVVVIQYECPINEIKCASPLPVTDSQILPIKKNVLPDYICQINLWYKITCVNILTFGKF